MSDYTEVIPTKPGHYVYRLWAADGTCLYVGCTGERRPQMLARRLRAHRNQKPWWADVARIDVCTLARIEDVAAEETEQITALRPLHNKVLLGVCGRGHPKEPGRDCQACKRTERDHAAEYAKGRQLGRPVTGAAKRALRRRQAGPGQAPMWFRVITSSA